MALTEEQRAKIQKIQDTANRQIAKILDDSMNEILDEIDIEDDETTDEETEEDKAE